MLSKVNPQAAEVGSLLAQYARKNNSGYVDCFTITAKVPNASLKRDVSARGFAESFFGCPAFVPERIVLKSASLVGKIFGRSLAGGPTEKKAGAASTRTVGPDSGQDAYGSGFFKVIETRSNEILLGSDVGTKTWLAVEAKKTDPTVTEITMQMGSVLSSEASESRVYKALIGPHIYYSRILLASAAGSYVKTLQTQP